MSAVASPALRSATRRWARVHPLPVRIMHWIDFLQRVGADLTAKYVYFICGDDYTESIDMPTALRPQTILATKYAGEIIGDPFGYPLRLRTSTKLGYKNVKWIKGHERIPRDLLE